MNDTERRKGTLTLLAQVLGLAATAVVIWMTILVPRLHRYSWSTLIGTALGYSIFAWAWSAAIACVLFWGLPRFERRDVVWHTLRVSSAAVWFAPAIILLSQFSVAALPAALVLVISTTRLLYMQWRVMHPQEEAVETRAARGLFGENDPPKPLLIKELRPAIGIAIWAHIGAILMLKGSNMLGGAFLAMVAATLTVHALRTGASEAESQRNLPRSALGAILTVLLAAGLTVGGLSGRVARRFRLAGDRDVPAERNRPKPEKANDVANGSFPGVILSPEVMPFTRLVAPRPAFLGGSERMQQPYSIPFGGDYWMYRWMYRRPPMNSIVQKGTPAALSFSTPDHWPLMMEAHQRFDEPIDLRCCNKIRVEIWNADRYPGTVSLELFAVKGEISVSLGNVQVQSVPNLKKEPVTAVSEILDYTIPPGMAIQECDELKVVFRRERGRMDKSARVAIDRFVLLPKGA